VLLLDQAAEVVAEHLAQHFVDHRHVGLAPHRIAELPLDHRERRFDVRLKVVVGHVLFLLELEVVDEAFLDVRGRERLFGPSQEIPRQIKDRIKAETGLIASVEVAPNKFLAKLASDFKKPDGLFVLAPGQVVAFLTPLPVGCLWGVGPKGEKRLHALGVRTVGQLAALPAQLLLDHFGEAGRHLADLANGRDDRVVTPDREAKSISTETTFDTDVGDRAALRTWLLDLVDQLGSRLRKAGLRARTVELKVRSSDFRTRMRSLSLREATAVTDALWHVALELFDRSVIADVLPGRLLEVGESGLTRDATVQAGISCSRVGSVLPVVGSKSAPEGTLLEPLGKMSCARLGAGCAA
jgi:DNA polymerase-4